jgi:hypothetical protein
MLVHLLISDPLFSCLGKSRLVTGELGGSCQIEIAQGVVELEVFKLTQKSGVYSVRAINKHH